MVLFSLENLNYKIRSDLRSDNNVIVIVGVLYRPPHGNFPSFVANFNEVMDKIGKENKQCYIMGAFNINLMNYQSNNITGEFLDAMYLNLLCPFKKSPY